MNLDDGLKGSKVLWSETVVIFDLIHGQPIAWQVEYSGRLEFVLRGKRGILKTSAKKN